MRRWYRTSKSLVELILGSENPGVTGVAMQINPVVNMNWSLDGPRTY